ncbi:YkvA family protein [Caloranaerobacter sp. DY30410]|uniref:YkvA family protein n=1 Tax=Caloranaerobacter sp. DY30410 TaxID=3238305 RepID=UPI003D075224
MSFIKRASTAIKYLLDSNVPFSKKIWIILGLIYLISPIDLLPEPILGFGIIDDIVLILYILAKLAEDLDEYINKENKIIENVEYEVKNEKD